MMKTGLVAATLVAVFASAPLFAQEPPPAAGPFVVRGEFDGAGEDWWYGYVDWKRGLVAFHGVDIVSWCEGMPTGYSVWYFQDNLPPAEEGLVRELLKGDDVVTSVWPTSILGQPGGFCTGVLDMGMPLAEGTVDIVSTDNDYFSWLYDHDRANAYGISAHGLVYTPEQERLIFNGGYRCVWLTGNDPAEDPGAHCTNKIVVR
jgi:hypothetical protein